MDTDDLEPPETPKGKPDLQMMSVEQLQDYIAEMETEIARVRDAIANKQTARGAADAVFKV
ncbi:MAG: DUF1192 domain-containing protein [Alphaproteobacteria bacterium]|jgi:uncharacterized small protein (DUF1192 family)|nr:DUF1192 domain-containing protein [Alphaproteobacteria bacterium]MDP6831819.1 DUF1192 domain-containing protein [Alphaproteobacteria bacterium]MDP6872621.1 DUF1192 domain-containing protein [Alphaproteobacteria bacterium]